jgi:glucosamine--fructose-6-phosphate aminotransferase (isomerizing)
MAALVGLAARIGAPVDAVALAGSMRPALAPTPARAAELDEAVAALAGAEAVFVTGRGPLHGLAEYVALLLTELARVPCAALEAAQFRHGPREAAGAALAVLALTARGPTTALLRRFAAEVAGLGSPTVLLDAGEPAQTAGVLTLTLPPVDELAAVLPMAVLAQQLAVGLAEARGVRPGVPLHSSKVTREE